VIFRPWNLLNGFEDDTNFTKESLEGNGGIVLAIEYTLYPGVRVNSGLAGSEHPLKTQSGMVGFQLIALHNVALAHACSHAGKLLEGP